jgi:hypothetical protein
MYNLFLYREKRKGDQNFTYGTKWVKSSCKSFPAFLNGNHRQNTQWKNILVLIYLVHGFLATFFTLKLCAMPACSYALLCYTDVFFPWQAACLFWHAWSISNLATMTMTFPFVERSV